MYSVSSSNERENLMCLLKDVSLCFENRLTEVQVVTQYLGLVQVKDVDAASLCNRVLECLAFFRVPIEKVVCFGSDGASVMTGG